MDDVTTAFYMFPKLNIINITHLKQVSHLFEIYPILRLDSIFNLSRGWLSKAGVSSIPGLALFLG